ncbi:MAG: hypothetical protein ACI4QA_03845 [Candidatus Spyradosoma sp.]
MRLFRNLFLCFALLLTLIGNTATTTACFADGEISFVGDAACTESPETAAHSDDAADCADADDFRAPHAPLTVSLDDDLSAIAFPKGVPAPDAFFFAEFFSALFDSAALRPRDAPPPFPPENTLLALLRAPNRAGVLPLLA